MTDTSGSRDAQVTAPQQSTSTPPPANLASRSRRSFLEKAGAFVTAGCAASAIGTGVLAAPLKAHATGQSQQDENQRLRRCFVLRTEAALRDGRVGIPNHPTNGDEFRYPNRIGNYSKGLPHNSVGEVDPAAYRSLLQAVNSGDAQDFENIIMGGTTRLVNPQSGLAFDMEGLDSHQFPQGPPPALASAQRAGEAVECYWMALLRDVNFTQYGTDSAALQAAAELSGLSDFRGPKVSGQVTPQTLFRGFTAGDMVGPYVSQFLLQPISYGAIPIDHRFITYLPLNAGGADYLADAASWLSAQNGFPPSLSNRIDPVYRHARNGRDLSAYVHVDVLFEAYLNACLWLLGNGAPFNPANPYYSSRNQAGFGTFGAPHFATMVAEVATRALKAVWYEKWFVHRALRPEEYGGLVHFTITQAAQYPLHADALKSQAVAAMFSRNGTYLLPQAFPEGCPQHPSYGAGHATVAGACTTVLKAFFDESWVIPNPMVASEDGLSLVAYNRPDAGQITVGGELNKLAANIGVGRNHAGVHWRSDYQDSLLLGEAVAISILRDQRNCYNEPVTGLTFTKFDGTSITI